MIRINVYIEDIQRYYFSLS